MFLWPSRTHCPVQSDHRAQHRVQQPVLTLQLPPGVSWTQDQSQQSVPRSSMKPEWRTSTRCWSEV
ncbi:hypothetical protein EYF80_032416 [Liparis tanakae]|uniref:Uncharacterized protein n=1 Tax=Liparis tanakae TaxID=230148 RepID=A0A4Z2GVU1_9TELE|nr:hypothetical protein EYF80_032416 [Liparis tanakae]